MTDNVVQRTKPQSAKASKDSYYYAFTQFIISRRSYTSIGLRCEGMCVTVYVCVCICVCV